MKNKLSLLALWLLVAALLAGCVFMPAAEPSGVAPEPSESGPTAPKLVPQPLPLARDGVSQFRIVYGASAGEDLIDAARYLQKELQRQTGAQLELTEDLAYTPQEDSYEILIGATDRLEDDLTYEQIDLVGQYIVCVQGYKLTVAATMPEATVQAIQELCDALGDHRTEDGLVLPEDFRQTGMVTDALAAQLPALNGGSLLAACDGGNETQLLVYQAQPEQCDRYIQKLEGAGYRLHTQRTIDENRYFTLLGETSTVTVMDNPQLGTVRVTVDPEVFALSTQPEDFAAVVQPSVTMLGLEGYSVSGTPNQNGLSMLYQLSDGSFIVVDGGHNTSLAARQLYNRMAKLAPDPSNIRIAAWLITHSHNDHAGAFLGFTKSYAHRVTLEKLLVNFANEAQIRASGSGNSYKKNVLKYSSYYPDVQVIKVHPGQVYYLADAVIEVLYTLDLYEPATLGDLNDSSIICTVSLGGQKVMQTGDCGLQTSGILTSIYQDALRCDVLQVAHHGYQGGTEELYQAVDPEYVLWPSGSSIYEKYKDATNNTWLLNNSRMKKLWVAGDDIYTLPLPIKDAA